MGAIMKLEQEKLAWTVATLLGGCWLFSLFQLIDARSRLVVYEEGLGLKTRYALLAEDLRDAVSSGNATPLED